VTGRLAVTLRHGGPAALAARRPSVAAGHVGGGGLVEEHQPIRVEDVLVREPVLPGGLHVRSILLSGVQVPFRRLAPDAGAEVSGQRVVSLVP